MKSFLEPIFSKALWASFRCVFLFLILGKFVNVVLYGVTFYHTVSEDYGEASPRAMLELTLLRLPQKVCPITQSRNCASTISGPCIYVNGRMLLAARCATRSAATLQHSRGSFIFQRLSGGLSCFCLEYRGWIVSSRVSKE